VERAGRPLSRTIMGPISPVGHRGVCSRDVIDRVEFKCLFAVVIDRFQLRQGEKREAVVKAGLAAKPHGVTRFG